MFAIYVSAARSPLWVSDSRESLERHLEVLDSRFGVGTYYIDAVVID
jgi:hypothetical protein